MSGLDSGLPPENPLLHAVGTVAWLLAVLVTVVVGPSVTARSHAGRLFAVGVVALVLVGIGFRTAAWLSAFRAPPATTAAAASTAADTPDRSADHDREVDHGDE